MSLGNYTLGAVALGALRPRVGTLSVANAAQGQSAGSVYLSIPIESRFMAAAVCAASVYDSNVDEPDAPLSLSPSAIARYTPDTIDDPMFFVIDTDEADVLYIDRATNAAAVDFGGYAGAVIVDVVDHDPLDARAALTLDAAYDRVRVRIYPSSVAEMSVGVIRVGRAARFDDPPVPLHGMAAGVNVIGDHATGFGNAIL